MKNPKTLKEQFIHDLQSDKDYQNAKEYGIKTGFGYVNPRDNVDLTTNEENYEINQPTPGLLY